MMRQSIGDSSDYFFDVELTKGKSFRLVDAVVPSDKDAVFQKNDSIIKDSVGTYYAIRGNVICEGKPVDNAQISLLVNNKEEKNTSSTSIGEFVFEHLLSSNKFQLIASKYGYDSATTEIDFSLNPFDSSKVYTILMYEKNKIHVSGVVKSKDSVVAQAQLDVYSNIEETKTHFTNDEGKFKFSVNPDGEYSMTVNKKGFLPAKTDLPINDLNDSTELRLDIQLDSLKMNQVMTINIYYEFDKSDIKRESELELDKFVEFMNINPTVSIEISAHTDERGSESYNLNLSKERARKVMNYLISEGKLGKNRIISNGYGENRPIIKNAQSDEEHQKNRRTEVKIIGL
jgi:outer membrane protein OmpA-like peptidoglycan-associated protein